MDINFQYRLFDVLGRMVQNGSSAFNTERNIQELQKGSYVIQIEANGDRQLLKFIKN